MVAENLPSETTSHWAALLAEGQLAWAGRLCGPPSWLLAQGSHLHAETRSASSRLRLGRQDRSKTATRCPEIGCLSLIKPCGCQQDVPTLGEIDKADYEERRRVLGE